jgi:hypothetical protein
MSNLRKNMRKCGLVLILMLPALNQEITLEWQEVGNI